MSMNNIWLAFITGLTTGGVSCFAVQGGLLASALASEKAKGLSAFLIAKVAAYTLLGFILGFLGASLKISTQFQAWMQILIGIYMIGTAARLLNIHPIFRYFVIQPPKSVLRLVKNQTQAKSIFTPVILGALTVLIPCGVTQAMMILALGSGSSLLGAGIMFAFTLGTTPVFFAIGLAATELLRHKAFSLVAAVVIFTIGIMSINSGQILRGSVHTLQNYWAVLIDNNTNSRTATIQNGFQEATIEVKSNGYKSNTNTLKLGVPVKLTLNSHGVVSCAKSFTIPSLKIYETLPEDGTKTVEFTPNKTGLLTYACGMGMYTGSFNVIE